MSFGVERRAPRGAFLWPAGAAAALGLTAAGVDGQLSMSVATLELLAAQAVAELGWYAQPDRDVRGDQLGLGGDGQGALVGRSTGSADVAGSVAGSATGSSAGVDHRTNEGLRSSLVGSAAELAESDVLASAEALVPSTRRARFDALYLALSQSTVGRGWSPAARAARALALAGRPEDGTLSARERAATAWDVLPVVFAGEARGDQDLGEAFGGTSSGGRLGGATQPVAGRTRGAAGQPLVSVGRDGGTATSGDASRGISSRAGEALGSYLTVSDERPAAPTARSQPSTSSTVASRAPSAAQEIVRPGRPSNRSGGGEVEIPAWFEQAARRMFDERSPGEGISMAEMTLVTAAPAAQIAASTRGVPSASAPAAPSAGHAGQGGEQKVDIEKVANDVYRAILALMDATRARNGEPYL
jgi:hypothetical protein